MTGPARARLARVVTRVVIRSTILALVLAIGVRVSPAVRDLLPFASAAAAK